MNPGYFIARVNMATINKTNYELYGDFFSKKIFLKAFHAENLNFYFKQA